MFSRTHKVDTFSSRWSPRVGGHNGHHNEILQGAMFASFSVLDYHIGSGTSSVCQLLPPIRFVHPRSLSLPRFSVQFSTLRSFIVFQNDPFFLCPLSPPLPRIAPFPPFLLPPPFRNLVHAMYLSSLAPFAAASFIGCLLA